MLAGGAGQHVVGFLLCVTKMLHLCGKSWELILLKCQLANPMELNAWIPISKLGLASKHQREIICRTINLGYLYIRLKLNPT